MMSRFTIILLLIVLGCSSQKSLISLKKSLSDDLTKYTMVINNRDYRNLVKYMPSYIVKSIGRKKMIEEIKQFYDESENYMEVKIDATFEIDTIIEIDGTFWARINQGQDIVMDMSEFDTDETNSTGLKLVLLKTRNFYGEDNVNFDMVNSILYIRNETPLIGLLENKSDWKFIDNNWETQLAIPIEIKGAK